MTPPAVKIVKMPLEDARRNSDCVVGNPKRLLDIVDLDVLRGILAKSLSNDAYVRSALYYAFTGRGKVRRLGEGSNTLLLLPHPNSPRSLLVFFPFARDGHTFCKQVVSLEKHSKFLMRFDRIFLARIPQTIVESAFRERGELTFGAAKLQKIHEEKLDWAYPSYDVSLEALANQEGSALRIYRKKVRKFDNRDVEILPLGEMHPEAVKNAILHVSRRWIWTKSGRLASHPERRLLLNEMLSPYRGLASLSGLETLEVDGFVLKRGNENLAFSFWEKPRTQDEAVACMAALPSSYEKGLSEFLYYRIAQTLCSQGYKTMCIGGSETAELDRFKRKLAPIHPYHQLNTLELDLKSPASRQAASSR